MGCSRSISPKLYGLNNGPAYYGNRTIKLNDYWDIIEVPDDMTDDQVKQLIINFLNDICSVEIPTSLTCNLRCDYCYIRDLWMKNIHISVSEIEKITTAITKKIFDFHKEKKPGYHLTSWGAEPLCNLDTLEYLGNYCLEHKYTLNLSTNGTNNSDRCYSLLDKFYTNKVIQGIQVSIDGSEEVHDFHRKTISGNGSFNEVKKFIKAVEVIGKKAGYERPIGVTGTIYLDDNTADMYYKSVEFFTDKDNDLMFFNIVPVRLENHTTYDERSRDIFIETINKSAPLLKKRADQYKMKFYDAYNRRIFYLTERKDGCPYCSAMRTQIGIDIDGSIYMCHGPITEPSLKPFFILGNIFEGYLNFRSIISNIDMIHSRTLFNGMCKECVIHKNKSGMLCFTCPPTSMSLTRTPWMIDYFRCEAYRGAYPTWLDLHNYMIGIDHE